MQPLSRRRRVPEYDGTDFHRQQQDCGVEEMGREGRDHTRWQLLKSFALLLLACALLFTWAVLTWHKETTPPAWPYNVLHRVGADPVGAGTNSRKFLVVGIPSVSRPHESYLEGTLQGLFDTVGPREMNLLRVVVQVGDLDPALSAARTAALQAEFQAEVQQGALEVIAVPPAEEYPPLDGLPQRYNDTAERTRWRAKQALDYALLMGYCRNHGDYYMQLEDDVIAAANWMSHVHRMIVQANTLKRDWFLIEFSRLGFIGKAFPAPALDEMVPYFTANYAVLPVDILLARLVRQRPNQHYMSDQALFQHAGYYSSLAGKVQTLTDPTYSAGDNDNEEDQDVRDYFADDIQGQAFAQPRPWYST